MLVVFEGIDGSGKTTVSNMVAERLRAAGLKVTHLREGGKFGSKVTQAIREFGRDARNLDLVPEAEFLLYVARDVQLIEEMTRPALASSDIVIADRFLYSAEALARFGRGLSLSFLRPVLDEAARGLAPDIVILCDVDPHVARARRKAARIVTPDRKPPSRKGLTGVGLQTRLREGYRQLASSDPSRWVVVDNDGELDAQVRRVTSLITRAHAEGAARAVAMFRAVSPTVGVPRMAQDAPSALRAFLAWVDDRASREPGVAAYLLGGLYGTGVDERRLRLLETAPEVVLAGTSGLDDAVSWDIRRALVERHPGRVARTLDEVGGPAARSLRRELAARCPADVASSLRGLDDADAWALREELAEPALDAVVASLEGLGSEQAWQMRARWFERHHKLNSYEEAHLAARSVTGLDDEHAWEVRARAFAEAPVSVLSSLTGLGSERAFTLREGYVARAPKAVMLSLRGIDDPRAWDLRNRVAVTCKEALDSITGLDVLAAWALRERCSDLWPSTVAKSLGMLGLEDRGRAMLERQLARFPGNVSLLKHASALALGVKKAFSVVD